jgi:hypothetical protein
VPSDRDPPIVRCVVIASACGRRSARADGVYLTFFSSMSYGT